MIEFVPAHPGHVGTLAARMREADRIECDALGYSPKLALRTGLLASAWAVTAKVEGRAEAMFGLTVVSAIEGEARPWMLGTDAIYGQGRALLRLGPRWVAQCRDDSNRLSNIVSVGNERAIRLLRHWGFIVESDEQMIGGYPFLTFRMTH